MSQMPDRATAIVQDGDPVLVDVEAEDTKARMGGGPHQRQPDIAKSDDANHPLSGSDPADQCICPNVIGIYRPLILSCWLCRSDAGKCLYLFPGHAPSSSPLHTLLASDAARTATIMSGYFQEFDEPRDRNPL